jgi:glycosyltransferase involved in cell wall biosynthesis
MALGTPVAVADTPALEEVTGDAAFSFDPRAPHELSTIIKDVLDSDRLCQTMADRGRRRAAEFRWSGTAARTLAVYDRLLAS